MKFSCKLLSPQEKMASSSKEAFLPTMIGVNFLRTLFGQLLAVSYASRGTACGACTSFLICLF